jgi:hypothetical protein
MYLVNVTYYPHSGSMQLCKSVFFAFYIPKVDFCSLCGNLEEAVIRHSPPCSLFAPVQIFRFLSVFHRCSIRGSVLVSAEGRAKFLHAQWGDGQRERKDYAKAPRRKDCNSPLSLSFATLRDRFSASRTLRAALATVWGPSTNKSHSWTRMNTDKKERRTN